MTEKKEIPVVSILLVAANVILYILCTFDGGLLYNMGELDAVKVLRGGEYERIFYSMFLHGNFQHLFSNMIILFFLGAMIEKEMGHLRYAFVYLLSGIGGNALSLLHKVIVGEQAASLGASGAIFGLDGVLLALVFFSGRKIENATPIRVLLMIAFSLYGGFTSLNVDNAAHVGGLLTGFLFGIVLCTIKRKQSEQQNGEVEL